MDRRIGLDNVTFDRSRTFAASQQDGLNPNLNFVVLNRVTGWQILYTRRQNHANF